MLAHAHHQKAARNISQSIPNVTLNRQANAYFGGKCVSHSFTLANGSRKSAGVVPPAELTLTTGAAEIMECVARSCEWRLPGSNEWRQAGPGHRFHAPAQSSFNIRVAEAYHYICHYA